MVWRYQPNTKSVLGPLNNTLHCKKEKKSQNQSQLKTKISQQIVGEIKSKFYCAVLNYQKSRIVCGINAKILLAIHIKT